MRSISENEDSGDDLALSARRGEPREEDIDGGHIPATPAVTMLAGAVSDSGSSPGVIVLPVPEDDPEMVEARDKLVEELEQKALKAREISDSAPQSILDQTQVPKLTAPDFRPGRNQLRNQAVLRHP